MAKFTPGPTVAEVRGSIGGTVYARNRYGAYMRNRAKPTVSTTGFAIAAKARMTSATQAWQNLTSAQRLAWGQWARANPIIGSLGFPQSLSGHAAFVGVSCRRLFMGVALPSDPPITPAPSPLASMSFVPDKTAGTFNIAFTPTPTGPTDLLWITVCQVASSGVHYIENLLKQTTNSGQAAASPHDAMAAVETRIGNLVIGYECFLRVAVYGNTTGLLGAPLHAQATIV